LLSLLLLLTSAAPTHLELEQQPTAFALITAADGDRRIWRITLPALSESLQLSRGASGAVLELGSKSGVRAEMESGSERVELWLDFGAAASVVDTGGRARLDRTCIATLADGTKSFELRLSLEVDLLGLGDPRQGVTVPRAEVISLASEPHGPLENAALLRVSRLAVPGAPLIWLKRTSS
jgi:hypothetical protein